MQVQIVKKAMQSIADHAAGDEQALCTAAGGPLDPTLLGTFDARGELRVRLYRSRAASCKHGQFLIRTAAAKLRKRDCFAYVPYIVGASDASDSEGDPTQVDNNVLKVTGIYAWHQPGPHGQVEVHRFVLGRMSSLEPCGTAAAGYEICYADGTNGDRARKPSLLKKRQTPSYVYGAWLSQVDCTMVSTVDEQWFIPTLKLAHFG